MNDDPDSVRFTAAAEVAAYLYRSYDDVRHLADAVAGEFGSAQTVDGIQAGLGALIKALVGARVTARMLPRDVDVDFDYAHHYVLELLESRIIAREKDEANRPTSRAVPSAPNHLALSLVRRAVRVVPVGHRCRYDEEFCAELTELATEKGRLTQVGYAFRVLVRGLALRRALRGVAVERVES